MMKSAADPYEFFRWKSSCGRLVVRTTWVKGVRHVVLSDDDDDDKPLEKEKRQPRKGRNNDRGDGGRKTPNRPPLSEIDENHEPSSSVAWSSYSHNGGGGDESYVERVLQWLQKPTGMLETRRKPMSAPGHGVRRPALVKTCSIPENRFADHQMVEDDCNKRPTKSTRNCYAKSSAHNQKTELHVHMPSMCLTANDNGKDVYNE